MDERITINRKKLREYGIFFAGIVISFVLQFAYDGFGPSSNINQFWGGLAIAVVLISWLFAIALLLRFSTTPDNSNSGNNDVEKEEKANTEKVPKEPEKDEERKKALRMMYKNLRDDNWQRGQGIWIANSILITGSLFVIFQSESVSALTYLVALMLVGIANFLHLTTDVVTAITYKQMEKIGNEIGLEQVKKNYEVDIKNKWWYPFRKGASYVLFSFLIAGYLFLWLNDLGLSVSMFFIILFFNLASIFYYVYFYK